jgi:hypothetical protein
VILRGHKFADPMPQKAKAPRNRRPGALTHPERPELFIGLVGAVGTELDLVAGHLGQSLEKFGYSTSIIRLASLLHALPRYRGLPRSKGKPIDEYIDSHMTMAGFDSVVTVMAWFCQLSRPLVLSAFGGCSGNGQWRDILYRFRLNQR